MATKKETLEDPDSCWNSARDDEPVFVIKGRDILFEQVVMYWAFLAQANGVPMEKVEEAIDVARKGGVYLDKKVPD